MAEDYSKDGATFRIPVTLASVAGIETSVKYEISAPASWKDAEPGQGAIGGTDYELTDNSGVLSFNAENRTCYIEFTTKENGTYTGDLEFSIQLFGNDDVVAGSEDKCTVKITDIDHPLSFMLGEYTMSGIKYGGTPNTWTMTILKDSEDESKVWFDNLFGNSGWVAEDTRYYGIVTMNPSGNVHTLNIPFGQESEYLYGGTTPVTLYGLTADLDATTNGSLDVAIKVDGSNVTLDFGTEWGFWFYIEDAGSIGTYLPGLSAVKK